MQPTFISLFAGVGGFDLGLEKAGFKCVAQVEYDKHAAGVLAHKFPGTKILADVTKVEPDDLPDADVITYGFPCQDLSIAGKQAGLNGKRSGLFYEATRLIRGLLARRSRLRFAVAENVAALFSADNGTALARCIRELLDSGSREAGWALLDSQHFGVAQRRKRVFIVSDFRGEAVDEVLAITESLSGNPAPIREAQNETSEDSTQSSKITSVAADPWSGTTTEELALTLTAKQGAGDASGAKVIQYPSVEVVGSLTDGAHMGGGLNGQDVYTGRVLAFHATQDPISSENKTPCQSGNAQTAICDDLNIRRLTPLECERLQGFPDNWTENKQEVEQDGNLWKPTGKTVKQVDGHRYKQMGNAVTVNVAYWLGKQMKKAL